MTIANFSLSFKVIDASDEGNGFTFRVLLSEAFALVGSMVQSIQNGKGMMKVLSDSPPCCSIRTGLSNTNVKQFRN